MDTDFSNSHNLVEPRGETSRPFGIRVTLIDSDPFRRLLPEKWETFHWYADSAERDAALEDMRARHRYSRLGDAPAIRYEPIDR
ncbi:MAG: hypothetical protein ACN4GT_03040 [Gammaproteobacteria bacterium]